jgi:hypothetical protein
MNPSIALLDEALAKSRGTQPRPSEKAIKDRAVKHVRALSSVINYIITDAFGLDAEESMWLGYNLNQVLEPLTELLPTSILVAVDQEMRCEEYSNRLMTLLANPNRIASNSISKTPGVKYATLNAWVEGICEIILGSYPSIRPMYKARIVGSVHGLFQELGLTNNLKTSRASLYLPTSVRFILSSEEQED